MQHRSEQAVNRRAATDATDWRRGEDGIEPPELRQVQPMQGPALPVSGSPCAGHFPALCFEYAPEVVTVHLQIPAEVDQALEAVQAARTALARRRFPSITPVYPQPYLECALAIVTQDWCQDVYVCF